MLARLSHSIFMPLVVIFPMALLVQFELINFVFSFEQALGGLGSFNINAAFVMALVLSCWYGIVALKRGFWAWWVIKSLFSPLCYIGFRPDIAFV